MALHDVGVCLDEFSACNGPHGAQTRPFEREVTYGEQHLHGMRAADGNEIGRVVAVGADDVYVGSVVETDVHRWSWSRR